MNLFDRAYRFYRANGVGALPAKTVRYIGRHIPARPHPAARRRRQLGMQLFKETGGTVLEGPLKGFRLADTSRWGGAAYAPLLLGIYEAQVMAALIELSSSADLLIDIGAADGYFGVGLVAKGYFSRSACFEIDPESRRILGDVAKVHGVGGQVEVFEGAGDDLVAQLRARGLDADNAVVLCDIEGAEFDLLTPALLETLRSCSMIIELHERYFEDGAAKLARLMSDVDHHFEAAFLERSPCTLPDHEAVRDLSEDDRWLMCSEGRGIEQRWLLLRPKAAPQNLPK